MVVSQKLRSAYVVIDEETCKGCGLCIPACRKGIIGPASHVNQSGYSPATLDGKANLCTGCAACAVMCPDSAIAVYRSAGQQTGRYSES